MTTTPPGNASLRSWRARWVVPIEGPPIAGGVLSVHGDRIVKLGRWSGEEATDLGDVALLPALVNAHTHLEFSDLSRPLGTPGQRLPDWIRSVIAQRRRGDRSIESSIELGLNESLRLGVGVVGEIASAPAAAYRRTNLLERLALYHEVIGFSAARADSALSLALLQRTAALGEYLRHGVGGPTPGLSPHAPYTVHPRLLLNLVDEATRSPFPLAMHLAESPEELQFLATGGGPFRELLEERSMWDAEAIAGFARPLDYLRLLARAPRALIVHGNFLASDEIEFIRAHGDRLSVAYCPRTHAYFEHPRYPLPELIAAGVQVVFGTDSRASNPDLDLLAEVRFVAARFPEVAPERLLRMATIDAARALGVEDDWGTLTPGKRGDLIAIPCSSSARDPYESFVHGDAAARFVARRGVPVSRGRFNSLSGNEPLADNEC